MTPETSPLITAIAAVLQKDYAIGPDSAPSIVRKVLELSASYPATGWSHDEYCPPEDCAVCLEKAKETMCEKDPQ